MGINGKAEKRCKEPEDIQTRAFPKDIMRRRISSKQLK